MPRKINKVALRAYFEKYKHLIKDKDIACKLEALINELL